MPPNTGVDLHLHTTIHDGRWTPAGLVEHAAGHGIAIMAISDHDMTAGIEPAQRAAVQRGVCVIPAVEVTSLWQGSEYHVLLYGQGIHPRRPQLAALLDAIHARQLQRAREWVEALAARGMNLPSLDSVRRGRKLMPIYVAGALLRDNHVPDYASCVTLLKGLPSSVEPAAPIEEVVAAAHAVGAVAIVAHPGRNENGFAALSSADLDAMRAVAPFDGVEVYHPNHNAALRAQYLAYATERSLLVSAGSDSHGPAHARVPTAHPATCCEALLERILPAARPAPALTADLVGRL